MTAGDAILNHGAPVAHKTDSWEFRWVDDWRDVWDPAFVATWRRCIDESSDPHVFFEPAMVRAWVETYQAIYDVRPLFLCATNDRGARILLPLVWLRSGWKDLWKKSIVPVGYAGFDYHDPIAMGVDSPQVWSTFWQEFERDLRGRWGDRFDSAAIYGLRYSCLPVDLRWSPHHEVEIGPNGPINGNVSPTIDLRRFTTVDDVLRSRDSRLRGDVGRQLRRMADRGQVTFHVFEPHEVEEVTSSIGGMLQQNARRWPMTWRLRPLYDHLVRYCLPAGLLHMSELRIDGAPVSWHLGFIHRGRLYYYLPAFRPELAGLSPGKVHIRMLIADSIERGVATFDFLRGDEGYKRLWSDGETETFGLIWSSQRPAAQARHAWTSRMKPRLVRLRRRARLLLAKEAVAADR